MPEFGTAKVPSVSRRDFLFAAAVGGGAIAGAGLIGSQAHAANKMPQKTVNYMATSKTDQRCDNCALWQAPSSCKLVDGTIAPSGWCTLYKKKWGEGGGRSFFSRESLP